MDSNKNNEQKTEEKKNILSRLGGGIKEYYGPLPMLSGLLVAGVVNVAVFTIAAVYNSGNGVTNFLTNGNGDLVSALYKIPDSIGRLYAESRMVASDWTMPGFAVGQFVGYRVRNTTRSWFKKK